MLSALQDRFHFGLDQLEFEIVDAKTVLRHKLNQIHGQAADPLEEVLKDDLMQFEFDNHEVAVAAPQTGDAPEARKPEAAADADEARRIVEARVDEARRMVEGDDACRMPEETRRKPVEERIRADAETERQDQKPANVQGTGAESSPIIIGDDDSAPAPLTPGQGLLDNPWDEKVPLPPPSPRKQVPPSPPSQPAPTAQPLPLSSSFSAPIEDETAADQPLPADQSVDDVRFAEFLTSTPKDGVGGAGVDVDGPGDVGGGVGVGDDMGMEGIVMGGGLIDDSDLVMGGGGEVTMVGRVDASSGAGANETAVELAYDGNGGGGEGDEAGGTGDGGASKAVDETYEDDVFDF